MNYDAEGKLVLNKVEQARWEEMIKIEPKLEQMYLKAQGYQKYWNEVERFCANEKWYGYSGNASMKRQLVGLTGWDAKNRLLSDEKDYDIAYHKIYEEFPDCKNCACLGGGVQV